MQGQPSLDRRLVADDPPPLRWRLQNFQLQGGISRHVFVAIILFVALLAFEIFNFDTTRFALEGFLGDVRFAGIAWSSILAVAFCSIDFAGLVRMFTPEEGLGERKEVWYLMGAWLLGATMNAVMTWWAVSLALLNHEFGNEVLGREQLLRIVPVFVAVLVWLTRILFIGAVSMAGEQLMNQHRRQRNSVASQAPARQLAAPKRAPATQQAAAAGSTSRARQGATIKERPSGMPSNAPRRPAATNERPRVKTPTPRTTGVRRRPPSAYRKPTAGDNNHSPRPNTSLEARERRLQ